MCRAGWFSAIALITFAPIVLGGEPRSIKPVIVLTGIDSRKETSQVVRCSTRDEWVAAWRSHAGDDAAKAKTMHEVDFTNYMLVAIFDGKSYANTGLSIHSVEEGESSIQLRYRRNSYQSDIFTTRDRSTQSFMFVILPNSQKELIFERDTRRIIQAPPEWTEQSRLPTIKK